MKSITLYHQGIPIIHKPLINPRIHIGTAHHNDLIVESSTLKDSQVTIEMDTAGKWKCHYSPPLNSLAPSAPKEIVLGSRIPLGEFEIELSIRTPSGEPHIQKNFGIIGQSSRMKLLRRQISHFGPLQAPLLIEGESGTGKELAAKGLHDVSIGNRGPLVSINCGAIHSTLLEDIFFGHEKGAFTGATSSHKGAFERAHRGTLFLDEIGELPLSHQASLLRVLDNGIIHRIGGEAPKQVCFRLLTATNRNLLEMVDRKRFRLDLFHRISTLQLSTPALRHHAKDIPALAIHLLTEISSDVGPKKLSDSAQDILNKQRWRGNCRELRNVLYKSAALCKSTVISKSDLVLPNNVFIKPRRPRPNDKTIVAELAKMGGNVSQAAKSLGIPRTTFRYRMQQISIKNETPPALHCTKLTR